MAYPPGCRPLAKGEVELLTEGGVMAKRFLANFANKAAAYTSALCAFIVVLGAPVLSAQAKPGWQVAWDKTVKAAEKEGQVNIYFTLGPHRVVEDFQGRAGEWAKLLSEKPYPHPLAVWNVYNLEVAHDPKVNFIGPFETWDLHHLRTIDDSGFVDRLYQ